MDVVALDYYSIPKPDFHETRGQGDAPGGFTVTEDGSSLTILWGETVQASSNCKRPGNDSYDPTKVRQDILQELADNDQLVHEGSPS